MTIKSKNVNSKYYYTFGLAAFLTFLYYLKRDHDNKLAKECCYTYATITNVYYRWRSVLMSADYQFVVNGDTIRNDAFFDPDKIKVQVGDSFLVKYSEGDPATNKIHFYK